MSTLKTTYLQQTSSVNPNITLDSSGNATVYNTLAMGSSFLRNRIINGAMQIWQRGTSGFTTSNTYVYAADRMIMFSGTGVNATASQATNIGLAGFQYAMRAQRNNGNTGTNALLVGQTIETLNCFDLAGKTITISFWARKGADYSATSNALTVNIVTGTGTDQGTLAWINSTWTGQATTNAGTATLTTSWQQFSYSVAIPAGTNEVAWYVFGYPTGTAGANDYYDITGVQLEVGSVATPFERRQYGQELMLCQRYLPYFSYASGANPYFGAGMVTSLSSSTTAWFTIQFPVTPRVPPTGIVVSAASHFAAFLPSTATTNATGVTFGGANSLGASFTLSGLSGTTSGQSSLCFMNNSAAVMYFTGCEL